MGRDNPPWERQRKQLERKQNQRDSYDRILIVSEGSKTEPNYFNEIRAAYRLCTANVMVQPSELGTEPIQVVSYAKKLFLEGNSRKEIQPRTFEQVFAVFDRDNHPSYSDALKKAESLDGKLKNDTCQPLRFQAVASVPCFELWLLLHYENIQAPLDRAEVLLRLKRHLPDYEKGAKGIFAATRDKLDVAMQRAEALANRFTAYRAPEPFTDVFKLVRLLTTLKIKD